MRSFSLVVWLMVASLIACKKENGADSADNTVVKLVLSSSKQTVYADGVDATQINVAAYNRGQKQVYGAEIAIYAGDKLLTGKTFASKDVGNYTLVAKSGTITSNEIQINVIEIANKVAKIEITSDKDYVISGHYSKANIAVKLLDSKGSEVADDIPYQLYAGEERLDTTVFMTDVAGDHVLTARVLDVSSNQLLIKAKSPQEVVGKIVLEPDTRLLIANGKSTANLKVTVFDKNEQSLVATYDVFVDGTKQHLDSNRYVTNKSGAHVIQIKMGSLAGASVSINARADKGYSIITVPVIFHIYEDLISSTWREDLWFGEQYDVSPEFIKKTLDILNNDFAARKTNSPNATDTRIRFRLAKFGPDGKTLAEAGIHRLNGKPYDSGAGVNSGYDIADDSKISMNESYKMAAAVNWDISQYINIHLVGSTNNGGGVSWATLPYLNAANALPGLPLGNFNSKNYNHILVNYSQMHIASFYNASNWPITLSHEMGHYLGLLHTYSENNCQTSDYCPDTYSFVYDTDGINQIITPCDANMGWSILDNFMGGSNLTRAETNFSYDQRERMQYVLKYSNALKELKVSAK